MFYSDEFKKRCKHAYPNFEQLHIALDNGSVIVGRFLDDNADGKLSVDTILEATSLKELKKLARVEKEKHSLYIEWCKLYDEEFGMYL